MKGLIKLFTLFGLIIAPIISFLLWYMFLSIGFSSMQLNKYQNQASDIPIYILSNGVHTDIVVPTVTSQIDWRDIFSPDNTKDKNHKLKYTAIGWGDKGFYLNTPQWSDLKFKTAFKAAFGLSESALHVTYYDTIQLANNCVKVLISKENYTHLVEFIQKTLKFPSVESNYIKTTANYGGTDAFYEANGKYHFFNTCNTWANKALKVAKIKAAVWTPVDKGIFYHHL